uniref:Uncharacterized protein n=1 Tax=Chenopodium quinoa TaxID=63459 RepID=A0A803N0M9_CHEQI
MVSFQTSFLQLNDQRKPISETTDDSKNNMKRKWNDTEDEEEVILPYKHWRNPKAATAIAAFASKSFSDIELHLETPLPSEWQRGNTLLQHKNTKKNTKEIQGKAQNHQSPKDCHMSLDLELNLPCGSLNQNISKSTSEKNTTTMIKKKSSHSPPPSASPNLFRSLSTVRKTNTIDVETADDAEEMVANRLQTVPYAGDAVQILTYMSQLQICAPSMPEPS